MQTKKRGTDVFRDLSAGFARLRKLYQFSIEKPLELYTQHSNTLQYNTCIHSLMACTIGVRSAERLKTFLFCKRYGDI